MGIVIEMKNVTYHYPLAEKAAIKNMSLQIEEGKFYGVIGANGSGKTTLCALLRGFAPSFYKGELEGEVLVDGRPTTDYEEGELSLRIGYVFQNPFNQISGVKDTVFEEVAYGLENFGVPRDRIEPRMAEALDAMGISHLRDRVIATLSGGQKQKVAIASILALRPRVLVLDEPTAELDPASSLAVFDLLARYASEHGTTVVVVEQKIALWGCGRILGLLRLSARAFCDDLRWSRKTSSSHWP